MVHWVLKYITVPLTPLVYRAWGVLVGNGARLTAVEGACTAKLAAFTTALEPAT
jgi:hypothetical protein